MPGLPIGFFCTALNYSIPYDNSDIRLKAFQQFSLWKFGLQMGLVFKNKTLAIRILSSLTSEEKQRLQSEKNWSFLD
jgi:hypothetical protein